MEYEIQPFDLKNASDEEWKQFYNFNCNSGTELFPDFPTPDLATMKTNMIENLVFCDVEAHIVTKVDPPSEAIGWLRCTFLRESDPSFPGNEDVCKIHLTVLKDYRRMRIARELLAYACEHAMKYNRTKFTGALLNDAARKFLQRIGGNEALAYRISQLQLKDVDWELMTQWMEEGPMRSPTSRLEFHSSIPDSILEDYCKVYTEVLNQAPRDELTIGDEVFTPEKWKIIEERARETGELWQTALVMEQNGDISGLTDFGYNKAVPTIINQYLTGVQEKFRGRGLGKWLKAAMLLKIREDFPDVEVIATANATSNEPMLSINERMGFRLKQESYEYEVDLQKVKEYLAKDQP